MWLKAYKLKFYLVVSSFHDDYDIMDMEVRSTLEGSIKLAYIWRTELDFWIGVVLWKDDWQILVSFFRLSLHVHLLYRTHYYDVILQVGNLMINAFLLKTSQTILSSQSVVMA